jgi:hypothetical protein
MTRAVTRIVMGLAGAAALISLSGRGIELLSGVVVKAQASCGLQRASGPLAFCETFDAPAGIGNRSGDLNGTLWGVSRTSGGAGLGQPDPWVTSQLDLCGTSTTVNPEGDIRICNGQLHESSDDNISGAFEAGTVTALTMYPKQPFDFAGRTGTIGFDVSNDSHGSHGAWPELWVTNTPAPGPFAHFATWQSLPQFGFGIRFAGFTNATGQGASCPESGGSTYLGVDSAIIINNYVANDTASGGNLVVMGTDCVRAATSDAQLNHYEIAVSQNQIDVYGTDAGTTAPLKHLATIANANLGFTRGLVWFDDVHYNADKADITNPSLTQHNHTFVWDNVGFDGPPLARDLSFDVLDSRVPLTGGLFLGYQSTASAPITVTTLPMTTTNISAAAASKLLFNFMAQAAPLTFTYLINGHPYTAAWPYPDTMSFTWKAIALPINLSDLVGGSNAISISATAPMVVANIDIVLAGAGGMPNLTPPATPTNFRIALALLPISWPSR